MQALTAYAQARGAVVLRMRSPMIKEDAAHVWVDVAYEGSWTGHPAGEFVFDRDVFRQIVDNFERNPNPVPLDWEHSTEWASQAPAAGWVQKLEVREDDAGKAHLFALVELGDKAAEQIRAGEYRFTSGVFDFDATDPVTGEPIGCAMPSLALTNTPFIRGQTPLRLSTRRLGGRMRVSKEALMAALEGLESADIGPEDLEAALHYAAAQEGVTDEPDEPAPAAEEEMPMAQDSPEELPMQEPPEAMPDAEMAAQAAVAPLMEDLGIDLAELAARITEYRDAVVSALRGDGETPMSEDKDAVAAKLEGLRHQMSAKDKAISALTTEVKALSAERDARIKADAKRAVSVLVDSGRLLDNGRDFAERLYCSDRGEFDRFSASLPEVVPQGQHASGVEENTGDPDIPDTAEVRQLRRMLKSARLSPEQIDAAIRRQLNATPTAN